MFCESYRESLRHVAIAGEALTRTQEEHLHGCRACRMALAEERAVVDAIDSGLSSIANADTPVSLPASVRARVEAAPAPANTWFFPSLACASAALALGIGFVLFHAQPKPADPERVAGPQVRPAAPAAALDPAPLSIASGSSSARFGRSIPPSRKAHASARAFESQVLVSQEEQLHFQKYLASLRAPGILSGEKVVVKSDPDSQIVKLEITELEFGQLSIEPLSFGDAQ